MTELAPILESASRILAYVGRTLGHMLLSPSSDLFVGSLLSALVIAALWLARRHAVSGLPIRIKALARLLFPRRWVAARSAHLDLKLMLLNALVFGVVLAGAIVSHQMISGGTKVLLAGAFGPSVPSGVSEFAGAAILTVALFLAYELAYWVYHYLSHTVPALWELHKVHHSAEVLTPLTNSRVHPIEGILFLNTLAIFLGVTDGTLTYLLGQPAKQFSLANVNLIVVVFTYLLAHLHHTHVWIAFTGPLGRIFISPAHHQIHHSTNPIHWNKNMGSVLAIWDWLFGTLHVPARHRERLTFGLGDGEVTEHSVTQELLRPVNALAALATTSGRGGTSTVADNAGAGLHLETKA